MPTKFYQAHNHNTYYFSNIIFNVLYDPIPYLRNTEGFCGDMATQYFSRPFPKWSALHQYIEFIIDSLFYEPDENLSLEQAFKDHKIEYETYKERMNTLDDKSESSYEDWLYEFPGTEAYENLSKAITREVFSVLFSNRELLLNFNVLISGYIASGFSVTDDDLIRFVNSNGKIKRQRIPEWAARAVFYRDRGKCTFCQKDLTGLLSPQFDSHMDHIVPLANGGINDVSNLQLLCAPCNLSKGVKSLPVSNLYEAWYDDEQ